jgi:RND family efflux transporter MFP subunit
MKKIVIIVVVIAALGGVAYYTGLFGGADPESQQAAGGQGPGAAGGQGQAQAGAAGRQGGGRGGRGGFQQQQMTVETTTVRRGSVSAAVTVVGNLIGNSTVSVTPRAAGRLQEISVRLGDRVSRGQRIAKIEDFEMQEQVRAQEAAEEVSRATIRQREADLQLATTNAERSRNLFARQLLPKQTLDDTESRLIAAQAQLDLARAQNTQSSARLQELRLNLANTVIVSPVDGFVASRTVDPGAFVGQNAAIVSVVDIASVRLVANVVERDLKQIGPGDGATVTVDAFPGEVFSGRIARVSPVLDPATRTAPIEVEIPNPSFRLKPGMYARVQVVTDQKREVLVVPANALVDIGGRRGVFIALDNSTVTYRPVNTGIEEENQIEILQGVAEGERVVTTGAGALREGDRVIYAGEGGGRQGAGAGRQGGNPQQDQATGGRGPAADGGEGGEQRATAAGRRGSADGAGAGTVQPAGGTTPDLGAPRGTRTGGDGTRQGGTGRRGARRGGGDGGQTPAQAPAN